jgi:hypothetical protein
MSAITNFFGAIVSLIAAFLGSILGIFNKKKGGEFFLEIDSSKEGALKPQPAKATVAAEPAQAKATVVSLIAAFLGSILGIFNKKKGGEFSLKIDSSKEGASKPQPAKAAVGDQPAQAKAAVAAEPAQVFPAPISAIATESPQAVAAVNQALNMPAPVVSIEPLNIPKFGPARRPGSNMKSFLDMAKSVRS